MIRMMMASILMISNEIPSSVIIVPILMTMAPILTMMVPIPLLSISAARDLDQALCFLAGHVVACYFPESGDIVNVRLPHSGTSLSALPQVKGGLTKHGLVV